MFWNKCLLYKGSSIETYNKIKNTLNLNNIKYKEKIENKNGNLGPMVDKMTIGTLGQKEDFSYEYSIIVDKENHEYAYYLINQI